MRKIIIIGSFVCYVNALSFPFDAKKCSDRAEEFYNHTQTLVEFEDNLKQSETVLKNTKIELESAKKDFNIAQKAKEKECSKPQTNARNEAMCASKSIQAQTKEDQLNEIQTTYNDAQENDRTSKEEYIGLLKDLKRSLRDLQNQCNVR